MDRRFYPEFEQNWDDRLFRSRILRELKKEDTILDLGAGAGIVPQMNFRGLAGRVCGVDLDPRVTQNPFLDEGVRTAGENLPYPDETFELVFSDNVLEHLQTPERIFNEVSRVLKPGGRFLVKTPNRSHYVPLIARLTPLGLHKYVNQLRGRKTEDTFPTCYKVNTPQDVARYATLAGLRLEEAQLVEGRPEYLRLSAPTYLAGVAYERLVNRAASLAKYRVLLIAVMSKPARAAQSLQKQRAYAG
jgi:SAM-dependent methyltransferase